MQINDLLQCRAEQHNVCTPVHHSTSSVPPLQAGWKKKNHFSSQWRAQEQEEGSESVLLRGPAVRPLFFMLTKKTMILDLHLLNWSIGDQRFLMRPQLYHDSVPRKSHFTRTGRGGEELTVSFVPSRFDSEQWRYLGVGGSSCIQQACFSSLGVFSLIIGVAFILPANRRSGEGEHQQGAITSPISWPQTKASRQAALLKMMYFWSKSLELSAAWPSAATWLLLDRFVPLIRADSDCRHCLCKEKMAGRNLPGVMRKLGWGREFSCGICCFIQYYKIRSVVITVNEITAKK